MEMCRLPFASSCVTGRTGMILSPWHYLVALFQRTDPLSPEVTADRHPGRIDEKYPEGDFRRSCR
jgi:hypothetical protein